jgi:hypothetical protein
MVEQKKGCGKWIKHLQDGVSQYCGEYNYLCPQCKKGDGKQ